jgi:hypothetical protein
MASRDETRRARRAAHYGKRCRSRTGMARVKATVDWLWAELADSDPETAGRSIDEVSSYVARHAQGLNERKGVRR